MIRSIKKNKILNAFVRKGFKSIHSMVTVFENKFLTRWDISGVVKVNINGKDINLFSNCDDNCTRDLFYGLEWETNELTIWTILAERSNIIFDIGANTGIYSLLSAKINPEAQIFAFEPNPVNNKRMKTNLEINNIKNISLVKKAVGNSQSDIEFTVPVNDEISLVSSAVGPFSESFFDIKYKQIIVPQIKLDDFVERENLDKIDLMKIDVEYYEFNVLKGAYKTLKRFSPVILCEVFMYEVLAGDKPNSKLINSISKTQAKDIQDLMSDLGYNFYAVGSRGLLKVDNLLSNADGGRNYIFSKKNSDNLYIPYSDRLNLLALLDSSI